MKDKGMPFGSKGPEDGKDEKSSANDLDGAKGGGMKHVVSPGADDMEKKKHMMMIALLRAAQGGAPGGMPMGGAPMGGAPPMGGPQMPPMMGGGGGY